MQDNLSNQRKWACNHCSLSPCCSWRLGSGWSNCLAVKTVAAGPSGGRQLVGSNATGSQAAPPPALPWSAARPARRIDMFHLFTCAVPHTQSAQSLPSHPIQLPLQYPNRLSIGPIICNSPQPTPSALYRRQLMNSKQFYGDNAAQHKGLEPLLLNNNDLQNVSDLHGLPAGIFPSVFCSGRMESNGGCLEISSGSMQGNQPVESFVISGNREN